LQGKHAVHPEGENASSRGVIEREGKGSFAAEISPHTGRLRGSGRAMFALAWAVWPLWTALTTFALVQHFNPVGLAFLVPPAIILPRSFFFGIYLRDHRVTIVSWYRTYRVDQSEIEALLARIYRGWLTSYDLGVNLFNSRLRMIGVRHKSGRDRMYPGTLMTNTSHRRVLMTLSGELGREIVTISL
jgi:hypothetical protein